MPDYLVNRQAQSTGEHEVHEITCSHLPAAVNRQSLGWHGTCHAALQAARRYFAVVDGCAHCSPECHTM